VPSREIVSLLDNELGDSPNQSVSGAAASASFHASKVGKKTARNAAVFSDGPHRVLARFAARIDRTPLVSFSSPY
jgi:hypothetical protein